MHEHNLAFIALSKGEGRYLTSKNIGIRYHYLREKIDTNDIQLEHIPTQD